MLKLTDNYSMTNLTTLKIGGPAKKFVAVNTEEGLIEAIAFAEKSQLPYLIIGGGSNLLVSDEEINYLVVKNEISGIEQREQTLIVKSGTTLQDLVDYATKHGLSGLQNLAGIPGTVGGAVYGNAGAYGQTISDHILRVITLSEGKNLKTLPKNECKFSYRDSIFKQTKELILEVTFQLEPGNPETLPKEVNDILTKRAVKYPAGLKCPGSFFKNIVAETLPKKLLEKIPQEKIVYGKLPAGALLEEVGAKGASLDGIEISPIHANLFINKDGGSAKSFRELAKLYAAKVKEKFGITLEPEVQFINLSAL